MYLIISLIVATLCFSNNEKATDGLISGLLSENIRIESQQLGYSLQYRVYTPQGYDRSQELPVIYLTDGQWYISQGQMVDILNKLISEEQIKPVLAVFIDNRDPDKLSKIRRNSQFLCNQTYVDFVSNELVPQIDKTYKTSKKSIDRGIMGISFGGLNAAFFGINASHTFGNIGMQSPALHPCPSIYEQYQSTPKLPIRIFLSTGAKNDTEIGTRQLKNILLKKGYTFDYHEVNQEHNWQNWRPLIDDALVYFFKK